MPILKGRADVYFAGDFHSLQHVKPMEGVNMFISAGGGRPLYPVDPHSPAAIWAVDEFGFTVLEADPQHLKITFIGTNGKELYSTTLDKDRH